MEVVVGLHFRRAFIFILALGGLLAVSHVALAQLTPQQIIDGLKRDTTRRGIRIGGDLGPQQTERPIAHVAANQPPPATPRLAAARQMPVIEGPAVNITINFPTNSAELTAVARQALGGLCVALPSKELAGEKFRIEGHTDNTGSPDVNKTLSQKRAESVVAFLTGCGVGPGRLEAVGMGQDSPLVSHPIQTDDYRNRRVRVVNVSS
jgi:OOP family OmpA-OmpF porin